MDRLSKKFLKGVHLRTEAIGWILELILVQGFVLLSLYSKLQTIKTACRETWSMLVVQLLTDPDILGILRST